METSERTDPGRPCARELGASWVRFEPEPLPEAYVLPSKSRSDRLGNTGKMFRLSGHSKGLLLNGKVFPDFVVRYLPKMQVPVAVLSPRHATPKARLYLLHGLGYSISTVFSLVKTARALHAIAEGGEGDPFATWFARRYPHLRVPLELVIYDVPPMGWAPTLADLPTGEAMGLYFKGIADELQAASPIDDFYVCRSASCAPGLIAAESAKGAVLTGATFPDADVIEANRVAIEEMERQGKEKPLWDVIYALLERLLDPDFAVRVRQAARAEIPVLSLIGEDDPETPLRAQQLWEDALQVSTRSDSRWQYIVPRAKHQVFRRLDDASPTEFSDSDPDVVAFRHLLTFLVAHTH